MKIMQIKNDFIINIINYIKGDELFIISVIFLIFINLMPIYFYKMILKNMYQNSKYYNLTQFFKL